MKYRIVGIPETVREEPYVFPVLSRRFRQIELKALVAGVDAVRARRVHPRAIDEQQPLHLPEPLAIRGVAFERSAESRPGGGA